MTLRVPAERPNDQEQVAPDITPITPIVIVICPFPQPPVKDAMEVAVVMVAQ